MKVATDALVATFKATCCRAWKAEEIAEDRLIRYAQAYLMLADIGYRPQAPSDGLGHIQLDDKQLRDSERLCREACEYAAAFRATEDDDRAHWVGCSNYSTNRAFVLCIEAARLLASGHDGDDLAVRVLKKAIKEIGSETLSSAAQSRRKLGQ